MNKFNIIIILMLELFFINCFSESDINKILYFNSIIPKNIDLYKRVLTTICCDDCVHIPKIENAGKFLTLENEYTCQLMHNGIKILKDCYYGSWMTTLIELLKGHHEPQEEKAFFEVLKYIPKNAVMLELGSYWGYYSLWFQKEIQGAQNFLIEPDPKNLIIGKRNFEINRMHGNFLQAMVGSYSFDSEKFVDWDYNEHQVKQVSMDDFSAENKLDFIHLLHSDIQGAEVNMLKGCKNLITQKRVGYFFISTHRGTHEDCLKFFQEAKLDILLSITREESFSADGLIVAKLPEISGPKNLEVSKRSVSFCNLINEVVNVKD